SLFTLADKTQLIARRRSMLHKMPRPEAPLARVLVALRTKQLWSAEDAAKKLGCSPAEWLRYERGRGVPQTEMLCALSALVGCRQETLLRAAAAAIPSRRRLPRRWPRS